MKKKWRQWNLITAQRGQLDDANHEADRLMRDHEARGVRILAVRVNLDAIVERLAEREEEPANV